MSEDAIYIIKRLGLYKIGRSKDPYMRIATIARRDTEIIRIEKLKNAHGLECVLHDILKSARRPISANCTGYTEYFDLNKYDLKMINDILDACKAGKDSEIIKKIAIWLTLNIWPETPDAVSALSVFCKAQGEATARRGGYYDGEK